MRHIEEKELKGDSLKRLIDRAKQAHTFAIIGSRDKDTGQDRSTELLNLISQVSLKSPNEKTFHQVVGWNTLLDNSNSEIERLYFVFNIALPIALYIAKQVNQKTIAWKDDIGFVVVEVKGKDQIWADFENYIKTKNYRIIEMINR